MSSLTNQSNTVLNENVSTGFEIQGHRIIKILGIVRGITVRSRNICTTIAALICACGGGKNSMLTHLCEVAREEAFQLLLTQATHIGANAVIGFRYEANDMGGGITEVLAYGTAVVIVEVNQL